MIFVVALIGCSHSSSVPTAVSVDELVSAGNPYLISRQDVDPKVVARFERGKRYLAESELVRAETEFTWIIERHPELSGPYLNMAVVYLERGQTDLAETFFGEALRANPQNLNAYNRYAIYLRESGRLRDAEQQYLAALSIWQGHSISHHNLAILYDLYLGEQDLALEHYRRYQELSGSESRQLAGWIADLQRQAALLAQGTHHVE